MTVDEFLPWADGLEGRWELHNGMPVAMAPERAGHGRTKFAAAKTIEQAIANANLACHVLLDCVAVRLDSRTTFQPDIVVHCGSPLRDDEREVPNPILVVEVLSPSTRAVDLRLKLKRYFEVDSLVHYLILDPDDRSAIYRQRGDQSSIDPFPPKEGLLRFDPPGFSVEVCALFPEPFE